MAASEQNGGNGQNGWVERETAIALAERYRLSFIPLEDYPVDYSLVQALPVDLMLRNKFVPVRRENGHMVIAMADPSDLMLLDELKAQLRVSLKVEVATWSAIEGVLRKGDASQRVLQEATEGFRVALVKETEQGEEVLDLDRLSGDEMSPIIKLVDTIVFTALEKRASDIHLETRDTDMIVRYRTDSGGVDHGHLAPGERLGKGAQFGNFSCADDPRIVIQRDAAGDLQRAHA